MRAVTRNVIAFTITDDTMVPDVAKLRCDGLSADRIADKHVGVTMRAVARNVIVEKIPPAKMHGLIHLPDSANLSGLVNCRAKVLAVGPRVTEGIKTGDIVVLDPVGKGWPWDEFAREDGKMTVSADAVLWVEED